MAFSLNLRVDLARLTDAELKQRYGVLRGELHQLEKIQGPVQSMTRWRGPIRHPRAYVFWAMCGISGIRELDVLVSAFAANMALTDVLAHAPGMRLHLILCELQDIQDEVQGRAGGRGRRGT